MIVFSVEKQGYSLWFLKICKQLKNECVFFKKVMLLPLVFEDFVATLK